MLKKIFHPSSSDHLISPAQPSQAYAANAKCNGTLTKLGVIPFTIIGFIEFPVFFLFSLHKSEIHKVTNNLSKCKKNKAIYIIIIMNPT